MMDFFFTDSATWFTVPAVAGSVFILLQLLLGSLGGDLDVDVDTDFDSDILGHGSGGQDFGILSLQTISAFLMGGGWMGLGAYRFLETSTTVSAIIAVVAGLLVGWMLVTLLRQMLKFQSNGNIGLKQMIGSTADVYVEVPAAGAGTGRVKVIVDGRQRELSAVQTGTEPIHTSTRVLVSDVNDATNTLIVSVPSAS